MPTRLTPAQKHMRDLEKLAKLLRRGKSAREAQAHFPNVTVRTVQRWAQEARALGL